MRTCTRLKCQHINHLNFCCFLEVNICQSFIFSKPLPAAFLRDFPDLLRIVGKSTQTSVRITSLLMSTGKGMLCKELYKSGTSFQSPKVSLTEEISLCKSTLSVFSMWDTSSLPHLPFLLKICAHTAFDRSVLHYATLYILFHRNKRKNSVELHQPPLISLSGRKVLPSFYIQYCLCGFGAISIF